MQTQTIEIVNIEDVYPLEDEYGNRYLQRDMDADANRDYIEALGASFKDGVPDTPPILVRDGGIYRIKDGNCRIAAMRAIGTKRFPAIIDSESTEQAIVETVVRTNCKKKYEPIEESRFVQQLALLNPDDYEVATAAGIEPEKVKRIRAGVKRAGDASEDMTLERLIAIEEFSDDAEIVDKFIHMSEKEFPRFYDDCVAERKRRQIRNEIIDAARERGITVGNSHPDDFAYITMINKAKDLDRLSAGCFLEVGNYCIYGYGPSDKTVDPEEEARKAFAEAEKAACADDLNHRIKWYLKRVKSRFGIYDFGKYIHSWLDKFLRNVWPTEDLPECTVDVASALCAFAADDGNRKDGPYGWDLETLSYRDEYLETLDTFIECGYDPTDHELSLMTKCKEHIDAED